jgi:uncharacterized membrane protein
MAGSHTTSSGLRRYFLIGSAIAEEIPCAGAASTRQQMRGYRAALSSAHKLERQRSNRN